MSLPPSSWKPNWPALWEFGARCAARPAAGVILPGPERLKVMRGVMKVFMDAHPVLPGEIQGHAFVKSHAMQQALIATRNARLATCKADLWHDPEHRSTTPVIDLAELQQNANSVRWGELLTLLRPRALGLLNSQGVDENDAEDLFAEAIAGMLKPRQNGTAVVRDLFVYEQLPPLFFSIVRRCVVDHIRHRHADRRAVRNTVALGNEIAQLDERTFSDWAADVADPLHGLTFTRLAEECEHTLTALQQRILTALYIEESATYMEVAHSAWFALAMNLKPNASDATRRRALDAQHDSAFDQLAEALGIPRSKS